MRIVAVIQARMGSSRLPGKVLKDLMGKTVLARVIERVKASKAADDIVVATTEKPADDAVASEAVRCGAKVFRGSEEDVLERYYLAAKENDAEAVMRVTADDPLIEPRVLSEMVKSFRRERIDYLSNNFGRRSFPLGLDAEVFRFDALETAFKEAREPYEREHVTPYLYRHPEKFLLKNYPNTTDLSRLRWTLDTAEDWDRILRIYAAVEQPGKIFTMEEALRHSKEFVLGTAQLGMRYGLGADEAPTEGKAREILREAVKRGVRRFDTARAYADAESRIGQEAPDAVVVTKLDPLAKLPAEAPEEKVRAAVDESVRQSCENLKKESLSGLLLHRWEHRKAFGGAVWKRLLELQKEGRVQKLGASVYSPREAMEALGDQDIKHIQLPFNALDRRWRGVAVTREKRPDVTIDARSIYLQGLLTLEKAPLERFEALGIRAFLEKLDKLAKEFGREGRADLCLAYARAQSWIDGVVLGAQTLDQFKENHRLFKKEPLSTEESLRVESELVGAKEELLNPSLWRNV